jgi:hypothetical protein
VSLALTTYLSYRYIELPFLALKEKYAVIKSGTKLDNDNEGPVTNSGDAAVEPKVINIVAK